ncbi:protein of unknown function [Streptomyces murinus]
MAGGGVRVRARRGRSHGSPRPWGTALPPAEKPTCLKNAPMYTPAAPRVRGRGRTPARDARREQPERPGANDPRALAEAARARRRKATHAPQP